MVRLLLAIALMGICGCGGKSATPPPIPAAQTAPFPGVKTGFEQDDENRVFQRFTEFKVEGGEKLEVTTAIVNAQREYMRREKADGRPAASKWMLEQLQGKDLDAFVRAFGEDSAYQPK